jgi:mlo protein
MAYEDPLFWVVPAVFAGFLVISLLFEVGVHALEHRLEHKGRHGLLAFVQTLKTEILLYGLLSLLLAMVQPALSQICIDKPSSPNESKEPQALKYPTKCSEQGDIEVLPYKKAHNIHVLIFMIAVSHISMALLSLAVCLLKVRSSRAGRFPFDAWFATNSSSANISNRRL